METVGIIVSHTPPYVWFLFGLLFLLGARRLKARRTHLALAALAPASFLTWSLASAALLFFSGDKDAVIVAWPVAFLAGALSGPIRTVRRPAHVHGWTFDYAATRLPLTLYMLLWSTRYGLGIWAGFAPSMAGSLELTGLTLSALTAGRTAADFIPPLVTALRARRVGAAAT